MASLDRLNELLAQSGQLLDEASREIRELQLEPEANIRRMGHALTSIFEVRMQIFEKRPDLKPDYLDR